MAKKVYGVKKGTKTGIFHTWKECEESVKGYPNAIFKGFATEEEAKNWLEGNDCEIKKETCKINKDKIVVFVDGSYNKETNTAGYGLLIAKGDEILLKDFSSFQNHPYNESWNVFGELKGTMKAIELAVANDFTELIIAYDYNGIEKFATGEWKPEKELTKEYVELVKKYENKVNLSFVKIKAHAKEEDGGHKFNKEVDKLAKIAVGIL